MNTLSIYISEKLQLNSDIQVEKKVLSNPTQLAGRLNKFLKELNNCHLAVKKRDGKPIFRIDFTGHKNDNNPVMYTELWDDNNFDDILKQDSDIVCCEEDGDNYDFWYIIDLTRVHTLFNNNYTKAYKALVKISNIINEKY